MQGNKEVMSVVSRESLILFGLQGLLLACFPLRRVRCSTDGNIPTTTQTCTGRDRAKKHSMALGIWDIWFLNALHSFWVRFVC